MADYNLPTWEFLLKKLLWKQLDFLHGQKILDFGSGNGATADYFAKDNDVCAIEPSAEMLKDRFQNHDYKQIVGSIEQLKQLESASYDVVFCHNVLEYAQGREEIVKEFYRVLKPGGILSIVKHNRPGRVMQMVVLLNNFDSANDLLDGKDSAASKFGTIRYYEDEDVTKWCDGFYIFKTYGIRTFWDLQQNQEIQEDVRWQEKILQIEARVADLEEYRKIAFFHHVILRKCGNVC